jgi:hypothetical protein
MDQDPAGPATRFDKISATLTRYATWWDAVPRGGIRYTAQARDLDTHPYALVTESIAEFERELGAAAL